MKQTIKKLTDLPFGFCGFSQFENALLDCRAASRLPQNAKTIIMFAFPYKVKDEKPKNISRYAAVPDYHEVVLNKLNEIAAVLSEKFPQNKFEAFCDNSPIPEVEAAVACGLGVLGVNRLLINERFGSFVFLGEIVTDLEAEYQNCRGECIGCLLCLNNCPVGLERERCVSALTQKKGELSESEKALIKECGSVWGCDICQSCCPMNEGREKTNIEEFISGYRDEYIKGEDIKSRAYAWRGEKVIRRNAEL